MRRWSAALLVLGLAACGGADTSEQIPTAPVGDPPAEGAFDITVGPGRPPTFTWSGGPAFIIGVKRTGYLDYTWRLQAPLGSTAITSGVAYGAIPPGATVTLDPITNTLPPIEPGVRYIVGIFLAEGRSATRIFQR